MNRRQYALAISFSISLLAVAFVPLSGQQSSSYDPWLDYNDDGMIDVEDLQALGSAYGTAGIPIEKAALAYDSDWLNISDKRGQYFPVIHNLGTTNFVPVILGKTTLDGLVHQRHFDGTGYIPGWNRTYGGTDTDYGRSMIQTADGGYIIAGWTSTLLAGYVVKTDEMGNMQWNKTYDAGGDDGFSSVVQSSEGGYALAGYTSYGAGGYDFWLVRIDESGRPMWNRTYGGASSEFASSLVQTDDGGYALAGYTNSFGAGGYDFWLVKTDRAGIQEWNETYGTSGKEEADWLIQTSDGGYLMAGVTNSSGYGSYDAYLVKTDSEGILQKKEQYGGANIDRAKSAIETTDGGYMIAGFTESYGTGLLSRDYWLFKIDRSLDLVWSKTYGGLGYDEAFSVVAAGDGGYLLAGRMYFETQPDVVFLKTDSEGTAQWSRTYGGAQEDIVVSCVKTKDGGYAAAGSTNSFSSNFDFYLIKMDPSGLVHYDYEGLSVVEYTGDFVLLYRGAIDQYWNYVRVRIWVVKENP